MRKLGLALGLALASCSGSSLPKVPRGPAVMEVRGSISDGPFLLGSADLRALPRRTLRGVEPGTRKAAAWTGTSVVALVGDRIEPKRGADTAVARTADGRAIPIPLIVIRRLQPVLADEADGTPLATPVLAWPTLEAPGLASDPRAEGWWARNVVAFEIVEWQRTFGRALATVEGAPDGARRGASAFAEHCVSCHRIRGAGGLKGPDLSAFASGGSAAAFAALLKDHPGSPPPDGERSDGEVTGEIWLFLRAIAAGGATSTPEELEGPRPGDSAAGRGRRPGR